MMIYDARAFQRPLAEKEGKENYNSNQDWHPNFCC